MITINIDKAKEIWKDKLREARKPILENLDVEYIKALEQNQDATDIVAQKQELRDITKSPELINAQTPEEIKSFWPEILG